MSEEERRDRPGDEETVVPALVEHLFREQAGRLVSLLVRHLGGRHLELAEEVVQEALISALQHWPYHGVPDRPEAWLMRAARNRALDRLRRDRAFADRVPALTRALTEAESRASGGDRDATLMRRARFLDGAIWGGGPDPDTDPAQDATANSNPGPDPKPKPDADSATVSSVQPASPETSRVPGAAEKTSPRTIASERAASERAASDRTASHPPVGEPPAPDQSSSPQPRSRAPSRLIRGGRADSATPFEDEVCMLFMVCHPDVPREARLVLTLKTVGGFSVAEIARAFLADERAIAQRLVRARQRIRAQALAFDLPAPADLAPRLDSVLDAVYLIFNEGYTAHAGESLVRRDLCDTALRFGRQLAAHPATAAPKTHALLALMAFQAARLPARAGAASRAARGGSVLADAAAASVTVSDRAAVKDNSVGAGRPGAVPDHEPMGPARAAPAGEPVDTVDGEELFPLADQDRSRWDPALIGLGFQQLVRAARGDELTSYHLQAGIASCHAAAPSLEATDWPRMLWFYDRLAELQPSPVVWLNRAVALAKVEGPAAGLAALADLPVDAALRRYHLWHAVQGAFAAELGERAEAAAHYRAALACQCTDPERRFLEARLAAVEPA